MIALMRNLEPGTFIDLAALTLRWLVLIGLGAAILNGGGGNTATAATLLAAGIWNVALTILLISGRRFDDRGTLRVGADLLVANLLFFFRSTGPGPFLWVGLLPVATAAMLVEWRGTLLGVLSSVISLGLQALVFSEPAAPYSLIAFMILGFTTGGLVVLYFRHGLLRRYETLQRGELRARQEVEKSAEERTRILVNAGEVLTRDLDSERIIKSSLSLCAPILSLSPDPESQPVGALLLLSEWDRETVCLEVASAWRFSAADQPVRFSSSGGLITRSLQEGQPRLSKEVSKDPELYRFAALRTCQAVYCIPLSSFADPHPVGVLLLAHPDENIFTQERREALDVIGRLAGHAIQNARRYRDLDLERERLIEILQENRSRLVRELHDGSTQSVSALALRANLIRRTFERDGKISVEELHKLEDLARSTAKEIRQMLFTLRPLELRPGKLDDSFEDLADNLRKSTGRSIVIAADPDVLDRLEPMQEAVIFYVAEEAIEIAHRNGNSEPVQVRLEAEEGELACLEVEYPGFLGNTIDVAAGYESRNSLSVSNMRERAALVNGYLRIETAENQEVKLRLLVPITVEAAERLRDRQ
jgi:signal transduction histidine kinase